MTEPGGEARGLIIACLLAALAGMVDAIGYLHLAGPFVSFMTGNSTELAVAIGQSDPAKAGFLAELIVLFVLGAAAGQVLAGVTGTWHMTWILAGAAMLLAISAVSAAAAEPMVVAMGSLNGSMHRAGKLPVSLTYVTGMLVRLGQGLGDFVTRRATDWGWLAQASPWIGLVAGAVIGSAAFVRLGETAVWVPVFLAGIYAVGSAVMPQPD